MRTLAELARLVEGELEGPPELVITGVASVNEAQPGEITLAADAKHWEKARTCAASAVLVPPEAPDIGKPVIRVRQPRLALARVLGAFATARRLPPGIHPTAVLAPDVTVGEGVAIGAGVVVEEGVRLGDGVALWPGVYVGAGAEIGSETVIYPNAVIGERVKVGSRVVIHAGAVLGADGFGFEWDGQRYVKVPQIGTVIVEDDVEIGANVTIDRATMGATVVGRGTKIDNLVQIGHNVRVGEHCLIVAQTGIAGSTRLGRRVILAGQTGVVGHLEIGDGVVAMARSMVARSLPAGAVVSGQPARPHREALQVQAVTQRLPNLLETVAQLRQRVAQLEAQLASGGTAGPNGLKAGTPQASETAASGGSQHPEGF